MKKVLVAVALVMGLGSSVAFAQNAENANAVVATAQAPQDEYTKIEVKDLPAAPKLSEKLILNQPSRKHR